ncbi:hypothetical protein ACFORG_21485 [Lutimaribacter marinistellae]|uniref:PRC-barrel domain-containing protein n=1 Tax=Lutimaribacter marinistellae TaxID=1820329 RepID=A0ABV7TNI8_9RHOB
MKRIFATAAALALATTSASALVLTESATRGDADETFLEENVEFVGNPVYDSTGMKIGNVTKVDANAAGDRRIHVMFDEGAVDGVAGWIFALDEMWESGGSIELTWSADAISTYLLSHAADKTAPDYNVVVVD